MTDSGIGFGFSGISLSEANDPVITAGAVPLLAKILRSDQPNVQQRAAGALANAAIGSQKAQGAIIAAGPGAGPVLVAMLSSGQPDVQQEAARTLGICGIWLAK
ncbi:hypothetical protein ABBQ38_012320 [Trebouxia sp. C0009 RCD-2024]